MIAILNDAGQSLQLTPGQNLLTELATSWLSDADLPAEFSYPIEAPLNDNNKQFVAFGYRPDAALPVSSMPVQVQMDGVLYRRCTYSFKVQGGKLNGYLKIDSSEVYDKIRKLSLLEALPDVIRIGDGLIDGYNSPATALAQRMRVIAGMAPGSFPLTFFPIRNEGMIEEGFSADKLPNFTRQVYINYWSGGAFKTDGQSSGSASGYLVVPQLHLWWVLERIFALAGYRIESDWLATEEAQRITVFNLTAMAVSGLGTASSTDTILQGHSIVAGMHLPDMNVLDFLKGIKSKHGLNITYNANERVVRIVRFIDAVAAGPAIDLTQYQSGPYDSENPDSQGYTVRDLIDTGDELNRTATGETLVPPPYVIGKGGLDISLGCGTTQLISEPVPGDQTKYWFVPTVRQPGNILDKLYKDSDRFPGVDGKRKNTVGLKTLTYRGLVAYSPGNVYPLASNDVKDGLQQVVGSQALKLSGPYGAWRKGLRAYFHFRDNTQKIAQPLLLPVSVLASLPLYRSVQLSLEDQIRRSYLISKVQADQPGPSGLCTVKLEVLTLPSGLDLAPDADDPTVWVELVKGAMVSVRDGNSQHFYNYIPLTVNIWASSNKTSPALGDGVMVNLRVYRLNYKFPVGSTPLTVVSTQEYILSYSVSGSSAVVNPKFILIESYLPNSGYDYYEETVSLDPGEGYNIIH